MFGSTAPDVIRVSRPPQGASRATRWHNHSHQEVPVMLASHLAAWIVLFYAAVDRLASNHNQTVLRS